MWRSLANEFTFPLAFDFFLTGVSSIKPASTSIRTSSDTGMGVVLLGLMIWDGPDLIFVSFEVLAVFFLGCDLLTSCSRETFFPERERASTNSTFTGMMALFGKRMTKEGKGQKVTC
jgi:hypothetical protein